MSAIAWMLNPPAPPQEWPAELCRFNGSAVANDEAPYTERDLELGRSPEDAAHLARLRGEADRVAAAPAHLVAAAAMLSSPELRASQRKYSKARLEKTAAHRGEQFAPLEPGQKRRRRIGPDGQPVKKKAAKRRDSQRLTALRTGEPIVYRGPQRAPGEMTYGQAARLIHRANDGDLVDLQDLERAHATIEKSRETAVVT